MTDPDDTGDGDVDKMMVARSLINEAFELHLKHQDHTNVLVEMRLTHAYETLGGDIADFHALDEEYRG